MKFIDSVRLKFKAGNGGNGIVAFHRELFVSEGGPSGGNGGRGGNVVLQGDEGLSTLLDLKSQKIIRAENGANGGVKKCQGRKGQDIVIRVPIGTMIYEAEKHTVLADITKHKQRVIIAVGGFGGKGNAAFASASNRVPQTAENGKLGEIVDVVCELKLLANAGLLGLPNAGKSTFINKVAATKAEVADYPFTTLKPQLGVVKRNDSTFVIADLPGLIAGASLGKGLGLQFLKHLERCEVLIHMIDMSTAEDQVAIYNLINHELSQYSAMVAQKPQIIVANKMDLSMAAANLEKFQKVIKQPVIPISALQGQNIETLLTTIQTAITTAQMREQTLYETKLQELQAFKLYEFVAAEQNLNTKLTIVEIHKGVFTVESDLVYAAYQKNPLNTHENILLFKIILQDLGVFEALTKKRAKPGDLIKIYDWNFEL